jgi:hypothetical protein
MVADIVQTPPTARLIGPASCRLPTSSAGCSHHACAHLRGLVHGTVKLFVRRDFTSGTGDGLVRRVLTVGVLPLAALFALTAGVLAVSVPESRSSGLIRGSCRVR